MSKAIKTETYDERKKRIEAAMLDMKLTLEEFSAKCTVRYDDRFENWHDWRVRADETLDGWIFDVPRIRSTEINYTTDEVIKLVYERFRGIQARRGQINWHSVYVGKVETVAAVAPKPNGNVVFNTAYISVVQDSVDRLWRYGTNYYVANQGSCSGAWFDGAIADSRETAILRGAAEILKAVETIREYREYERNQDVFRVFTNKLVGFIEAVKTEIRQPSLFDLI